jgi:hypothetical protein
MGCAHSGQNFAAGETSAPQLAQARWSGPAHSSQNFALAGLSCWQREHFMTSQ